MRSIKAITGVLLFILVTSPFVSSAKTPGILQRLQLGYSFVVMNDAEFRIKYGVPVFGDITEYNTKMNSGASSGFTVGTYFPIKRLGRSSMLVFGMDFLYNTLEWSGKLKTPGGDFPASFKATQFALPMGLDFKFGADALNVKNRRFCATLGLGIYPAYASTDFEAPNVTINPGIGGGGYAKVEAGMFTGICWKLRAIVGFGQFTYLDYSTKEVVVTNKLQGNTNVVISALIMPFSYTWKREEWWNTY